MVVMPEYLMTSSKQSPSKPRVISEVKKNCLSKLKLSFTNSFHDFGKSKYSGQLLWNTGNSEWVLRTAEVRQGSLILINKETSRVELKQALRELNLRPWTTPRTFCLAEAKGPRLLMLQALTEDEYEKWVRILAVELIRQTPFQNVRFFDIFSIIRCKESDKGSLRRGRSEECVAQAASDLWERSRNVKGKNIPQSEEVIDRSNSNDERKAEQKEDVTIKKIKVGYQSSVPVSQKEANELRNLWLRTRSMSSLIKRQEKTKDESDESGISSGDENLGDAVGRHVDSFSFLSVRERKNFFESLNSVPEVKVAENSNLVRSNSISNFKHTNLYLDKSKFHRRKRTKSLHDLHKIPVKEICQLFESQDTKGGGAVEERDKSTVIVLSQRRLQRGEKKLDKLRNQIVESEEAIKNISEDVKSIGSDTLNRKERLEIFTALQRRLEEENSRLDRLKEEAGRVIKGNQRTQMKLDRCNEKR